MKAGAPGTLGNQAEPVGPGVLTWAGTRINPAPHSINTVPLQPGDTTSHITGIASRAEPIQTDATHGADIRALCNQAELNVPNRDNNQNPYAYTSGPGMPVNQSVYPVHMGQPQTWTPPQWPQPQFTQPQYQPPPQYPYYQGPPIPLPSYLPQQSATQNQATTSWPNYTMTSQPIMPQPPMQQTPPMQQQPPMPQIMPHPLPMSQHVTMPGNYPALAFHAAPLNVTAGDKIRQQIISNVYIDFATLLGNESSEGSTSASLSYNSGRRHSRCTPPYMHSNILKNGHTWPNMLTRLGSWKPHTPNGNFMTNDFVVTVKGSHGHDSRFKWNSGVRPWPYFMKVMMSQKKRSLEPANKSVRSTKDTRDGPKNQPLINKYGIGRQVCAGHITKGERCLPRCRFDHKCLKCQGAHRQRNVEPNQGNQVEPILATGTWISPFGSSPIDVEVLEYFLKHDNAPYLVEGFTTGFDIPFEGPKPNNNHQI